jgi:hypothetical protein
MSPTTDGGSPETASSERRGYGIGARFLSYLSAAWCGLVPLVLAALWTAGFITLIQIFYPRLISTHRLPELVGALIAVCLGGIADFALGVAFGRFLLRAMPPYLLGGTRRRQLAIIAVSVCAPLVGIFILVMLLAGTLGVVAGARETTKWDEPLIFACVAGGALFVILWTIGAIGPLILRHNSPRAFLHRPFVLFLRRFSTFSDRTVEALILRQAKAGVPVVFLTPTRSRSKDWDPFLVGFAGLKLLHPLRSVPIVLRARDDDWQRAANELVDRAQTILVDISEGSASLGTETEMIDKARRWSDTVCLRRTAPTVGSGRDPLGAFGNARCIDYSKSWEEALPKLAMSLLVVLLAAFVIAVFITLAGGLALFLIGVLKDETSNVIVLSALGLVFAVVALISYSILWRPAVSRATKIELRKVLRAEHATSLPAERSVAMSLDQSMNDRPISIAVIACILLFIAAFDLFGALATIFMVNLPAIQETIAKNSIPAPMDYLMTFTGAIILIVSGIFMLRGANWARLLYICWGAFNLVIALFTSPAKSTLIPGVVLYLIVVFFLLRPKASAYFSRHNGVKTS